MTPSTRVRSLLDQMTRAEKIAQLQIVFRPNPDDAAALVRSGIGATFWPRSAAATNALQRVAVEETRLGIPVLIGLDVIHGQRTIGPIPLAQAASFDAGLVRELARLAAAESRSGGVTWTFSPMADISRDPRWGRVAEGFGEDVHLTSELTRAMVEGYQGDDLSAPDAIAATAKHFVAYGQPEGGRDYNTVDVSEHRLRNVHLEPFRAAVAAGAASVMAAFNTVSGVPMHANRRLLTDVLKGEWGFSGVVVGDAEGVRNLIPHAVAEDLADTVRLAYDAGLDVEMGGATGDAADAPLDAARIDDAVLRMLSLKEALGLFDRPYVDEAAEIVQPSGEARALAREAAIRSAVLLANDGTLPLAQPRRVLVTGPYAESTDHLGAWTQSFGADAGTIIDELRSRHPEIEFVAHPATGFFGEDLGLDGIAGAATGCDVALVLVGEPSHLSGEAASRSDLRLPGRQEELIHRVADTGIPFAVVLENGRPLVVADWIDRAPAVLEAWHGGSESPAAIVDLLFGDAEPAGRLPMTFPRSVGQIPVHYAHERTGRPATTGGTLAANETDIGLHGPANVEDKYTSKYLDLPLGPEFSFGHGSGYARFAHGPLRASHAHVDVDALASAPFTIEVDVENVSERAGDEVVLVFVEDVVASVAPPVRRLVGFQRKRVDAGATEAFAFAIGTDALGSWWVDGERSTFAVEPGLFRLHVGPTLDATQAVELRVDRSRG